jgi:hypothetical protein
MVLLCNGNLLNIKKNHKLNCNRNNDILNTLVIDNKKILKIQQDNNKFLNDNINNLNSNIYLINKNEPIQNRPSKN